MRNLLWAVLAAGCLLAGGGVSFAQDTVRLGGPSVQNDMYGSTDIDLVRGYGHGGYRGYYGGYRGFYAGYRGYYGGYGYYRPYYAGYYGAYYYPPVVYPSYYYSPYYYNSYYYPIAGQTAPTVTLQANYYAPVSNQPAPGQRYSEPVPVPGSNSTFPYDGGPRSPIPMPAPGAEVNPANDRGIVPLDGKLVSFPNETTGGFSPVGIPAAAPRLTTTTSAAPATKTATPTPRVIYPAYGER